MANNDILDSIFDIARGAVDEAGAPAATDIPDQEDTALVGPVTGEVLPDQEHPAETLPAVVTATPLPADTLDNDFEFAREKMRDLIGKGQHAIDSAILLAESGDNPRAYEVVGGMITAIVQANKELVNIHKTRKETTAVTPNASTLPTDGGGTVNIDKAVFVGRASDLLREIKALTKPKSDANAS